MSINEIAQNWTSWVFNISWQITLLIICVAIFASCFRNLSARLRYGLWLLVLLKIFLPPSLATIWGLGHWGIEPLTQEINQTISINENVDDEYRDIEKVESKPVMTEKVPTHLTPAYSTAPNNVEPQYVADESDTFGQDTMANVEDANLSSKEPETSSALEITITPSISIKDLLSIPFILFTTWIVGVVIFLFMIGYRYSRLLSHLRGAEILDEGPCVIELHRLAEKLNLKRIPEILVSDQVNSPFLIGPFRPRIILPMHLNDNLNDDVVHHILLHELSHIRRRDLPVVWLQTFGLALMWFHPLVWWALGRLRHERECATDETALATLDLQPADYGDSILKVIIAARANAMPALGLAGIYERQTRLQERLETIMRHEKISARPYRSAWVLVVLFALVTLPMAAVEKTSSSTNKAGATESYDKTSPVAQTVDINEPAASFGRTTPLDENSDSSLKKVETESDFASLRDMSVKSGDFIEAIDYEMQRVFLRIKKEHPYKDKIDLTGIWDAYQKRFKPEDDEIFSLIQSVESYHKEAMLKPNPVEYSWRLFHLLAEMYLDAGQEDDALEQSLSALETYPDVNYIIPSKHSKFQHIVNDRAGILWDIEGPDAAMEYALLTLKNNAKMQYIFLDWWRKRFEKNDMQDKYEEFLRNVVAAYNHRAVLYSDETESIRKYLLQGEFEDIDISDPSLQAEQSLILETLDPFVGKWVGRDEIDQKTAFKINPDNTFRIELKDSVKEFGWWEKHEDGYQLTGFKRGPIPTTLKVKGDTLIFDFEGEAKGKYDIEDFHRVNPKNGNKPIKEKSVSSLFGELIIGTWQGSIDNKIFMIQFRENGTWKVLQHSSGKIDDGTWRPKGDHYLVYEGDDLELLVYEHGEQLKIINAKNEDDFIMMNRVDENGKENKTSSAKAGAEIEVAPIVGKWHGSFRSTKVSLEITAGGKWLASEDGEDQVEVGHWEVVDGKYLGFEGDGLEFILSIHDDQLMVSNPDTDEAIFLKKADVKKNVKPGFLRTTPAKGEVDAVAIDPFVGHWKGIIEGRDVLLKIHQDKTYHALNNNDDEDRGAWFNLESGYQMVSSEEGVLPITIDLDGDTLTLGIIHDNETVTLHRVKNTSAKSSASQPTNDTIIGKWQIAFDDEFFVFEISENGTWTGSRGGKKEKEMGTWSQSGDRYLGLEEDDLEFHFYLSGDQLKISNPKNPDESMLLDRVDAAEILNSKAAPTKSSFSEIEHYIGQWYCEFGNESLYVKINADGTYSGIEEDNEDQGRWAYQVHGLQLFSDDHNKLDFLIVWDGENVAMEGGGEKFIFEKVYDSAPDDRIVGPWQGMYDGKTLNISFHQDGTFQGLDSGEADHGRWLKLENVYHLIHAEYGLMMYDLKLKGDFLHFNDIKNGRESFSVRRIKQNEDAPAINETIDPILGQWQGKFDGKEVVVQFHDDGSWSGHSVDMTEVDDGRWKRVGNIYQLVEQEDQVAITVDGDQLVIKDLYNDNQEQTMKRVKTSPSSKTDRQADDLLVGLWHGEGAVEGSILKFMANGEWTYQQTLYKENDEIDAFQWGLWEKRGANYWLSNRDKPIRETNIRVSRDKLVMQFPNHILYNNPNEDEVFLRWNRGKTATEKVALEKKVVTSDQLFGDVVNQAEVFEAVHNTVPKLNFWNEIGSTWNREFEYDPSIEGRWIVVDRVKDFESFNPNQREFTDPYAIDTLAINNQGGTSGPWRWT